MKSKAAFIVTQSLVVISTIVIVFILLMYNLHPIKLAITDILINTNCKRSVKAHTLMNVQGINIVQELNCPTKYKTITGDEEKIKEAIAEEMWTCWDNFGRGQYELFEASKEKFCVVCSVISFDERARNRVVEVQGISEYIASKKVFGDRSLFERMTGKMLDDIKIDKGRSGGAGATGIFGDGTESTSQGTTEGNADGMYADVEYKINTNKDYAVVFTYAKEDFWSRGKRVLIWTTVGFAVGAIAGIVIIATAGTAAPVLIGVGILIPTLAAGGAAGGLFSDTPDAEGAQQKGQSSLWIPGLILVENNKTKELECTYLPIEQKTD